MIRLLRHLFSHSTFDVGRSMFDVHFFSVPPWAHSFGHLTSDQ
jgi:hypothetical protein